MLFASLLFLALQDVAPAPAASETWTELRTGEPFELELLGRHALRLGDEEGESEQPARWGAVGIDRAGRALVQAEVGGAVHVFDAEGRELLVCRPPTPTRGDRIGFVAADGRGRVIVQRTFRGPADLYDERGIWIATGTPEGVEEGELHRIRLAPIPSAAGYWVLRDYEGFLRLEGGRALHALPKRPDGSRWRGPVFDVRGDGGLVVMDGPDRFVELDLPPPPPDPDPREHLFVYDAEGELERTLLLPKDLVRGFRAGTQLVVFLGSEVTFDAVDVLDLGTGIVRRALLGVELRAFTAWGVVEREGRVELWHLHKRSHALLRFALPDREAR